MADFCDLGEGDIQLGSLTQPTYDDSNGEVKSNDSNCFAGLTRTDPEKDEHSIDLDTWTQNIVAIKTPVKAFETTDPTMPGLDLEG